MLTTLNLFKSYIDKTNDEHDSALELLIGAASDEVLKYVDNVIDSKLIAKDRIIKDTSSLLFLENYPILELVELLTDDQTITRTSDEYLILSDQGIIQLYSDALNGSHFVRDDKISIQYYAGYDAIDILAGTNDRLDYTNDDGTAALSIDVGTYMIKDLVIEINAKAVVANADFVISYNSITKLFTLISSDALFSLLFSSGDNTSRSIGLSLGFLTTADKTGALTYSSDNSVLGIPKDIIQATNEIVLKMWKESPQGANAFGLKSERIEGEQAGTLAYIIDSMPPHVISILKRYQRVL